MKKIAIIDLDGTLISVNSFKIWLKVLTISSLKKFDLVTFCKIQFILLLRVLKIYSRKQMKLKLLIISNTSKYAFIKQDIASQCIPYFRNRLLKQIIESNYDYICIASAAPLFYLKAIIDEMNIPENKVIGSAFDHGVYFECAGDNKKLAVNNIKNDFKEGCHLYFYTDHFEDLPTALIADKTFLVEPNKETLDKFNQCNINYIIF